MFTIEKCVLLIYECFENIYTFCYGIPGVRFAHKCQPQPRMENVKLYGNNILVLL